MWFPLIPTRVHAVLDYLTGLLLIAAPWAFGFADSRPATIVAVAFGVATIGYSLITRYELGLVRLLPMTAHLSIDLAAGVLLASSPIVLGFANRITWPHLAVGVFEILAALVTARRPGATLAAEDARLEAGVS